MIRLLVLLLLAGCVGGKETVTSGGAAGGNPSAPQRWPINAFPRSLRISNQFTAAEEAKLRQAAADWTSAVANGANFFSVPAALVTDRSGVANLDSLLDNTMAIYKATTWNAELPPTALAVTQLFGVRHNTGNASEYVQIIEADVLINWSYQYYPTVVTGYDLYSVALHELGHFLGLGHVYDYSLDSVMFTTIGYSTVFPGPGADDISKLRSKYSLGALMPAGIVSAVHAPETDNQEVFESGDGVVIHLELHADGTCRHKEDGKLVKAHPHFLGH